jgi:hypothetical protein
MSDESVLSLTFWWPNHEDVVLDTYLRRSCNACTIVMVANEIPNFLALLLSIDSEGGDGHYARCLTITNW